MNSTIEQFSATNKANLQALESVSGQALAGVEKLVELNVAATKASLSESFALGKAVLSAKDVQEVIALQSDFAKGWAEKSAAYAQHLQTIVSGSSAEFTKAMEAKSGEAQKAFSEVMENITKNVPAGAETAVAAFKSAMTAGQNAVELAQTRTKKAA